MRWDGENGRKRPLAKCCRQQQFQKKNVTKKRKTTTRAPTKPERTTHPHLTHMHNIQKKAEELTTHDSIKGLYVEGGKVFDFAS